jgi:hypothetical protein
LEAAHGNKALSMNKSSKSDGAVTEQRTASGNGTTSQQWRADYVGGGWFRLTARAQWQSPRREPGGHGGESRCKPTEGQSGEPSDVEVPVGALNPPVSQAPLPGGEVLFSSPHHAK